MCVRLAPIDAHDISKDSVASVRLISRCQQERVPATFSIVVLDIVCREVAELVCHGAEDGRSVLSDEGLRQHEAAPASLSERERSLLPGCPGPQSPHAASACRREPPRPRCRRATSDRRVGVNCERAGGAGREKQRGRRRLKMIGIAREARALGAVTGACVLVELGLLGASLEGA
jgi:hypothetical protein